MENKFLKLIKELSDGYYLSGSQLTIEFDNKKDYLVTYRVRLYSPEMVTHLEIVASLCDYSLGIHKVKINNEFETEFIFFKN